MEFENSFEVPLPPDQAWKVLLDVPRIAPCMPGAELTEVLGDNRYKGKVSVKLGPITLSFNGTAQLLDINDAAHTANIKASGSDSKGRGGANANVAFRLEPTAAGSKVFVRTDLTLSGMVAQYGRSSGMIQTIADQLIGQFVQSLRKEIEQMPAAAPAQSAGMAASGEAAAPSATVAAPPPPQAKPISGFSLLWLAIRAMFGRLFSGRS
ncbi:SRPBCC family protein [Ferrovibrio sp.]|uniref:SRPBCC family protein n=1 Tax=Ferrovibrio sp. TaxID=1917215 RepID=UPI0035B484A6